MDGLIEFFSLALGQRALIASVLVGTMCGVLGCFIVLRNMSLIGDALSHAVLPGVVVGFIIFGTSALGIFMGAVAAGLFSAVMMTWIQQNVKTKNDAAIGIVFTAMFAIGVMAISKVSREGAHLDLDHFLFGNVLGLSDSDLYLTAFITAFVLISVVAFYRFLFATTFQPVIAETMGISVKAVHYFLMLLLSFAVVASLQAVGVILVVAMLITPASTALLLSTRLKWVLAIAAGVGILSAVTGLILAVYFNTTPGPAMVLMATLFYLLSVFFAPQKGLLFRFLHKRKTQLKIQLEDTLKQSLKLHERTQLTMENLINRLGFDAARVKKHINTLKQSGFLTLSGSALVITDTGIAEATKLVRAHRLWETFLVKNLGLSEEQIHEEAEKYEHILTEDLIDEMEADLDYPAADPHGSPIPQKRNEPQFSLSGLTVQQKAKIDGVQINEHLVSRLWRLGIGPDDAFEVVTSTDNTIVIKMEDDQHQLITVPVSLAKKVSVVNA